VAWLCTAVVAVLLVRTPDLWHWFVVPVWLCGVLIGGDALDWCLGRCHRFDPRGVIGLIGVHLFFLAPLLHVSWGYWMGYIIPPPDWREWLGGMAVLNALGLLAYRVCLRLVPASPPRGRSRTAWVVDTRWFYPVTGLALAVAGLLQVYAYSQYG